MKFASLTDRVGGPGSDAWEIHYAAASRQLNGENVIVLSIGQEMLECTPEAVLEAAVDSLNNGRHHYSEIGGELHLRESVAARYTKLWGNPVSASNVSIMSGAQNALFATSLCLLEKGDEAILIEPYYATYPATLSVGGAAISAVPTRPENDFLPSIDDVSSRITDKTRAILINSPHNPSGMVYPERLIVDLVNLCKDKGIWLISDEVYAFFPEPGTFRSPASLPGAFEHCVTVSSVSKSHRMTGWRVGWVIASEPLIEKLFSLSLCMSYGLPPFTQDAASTALGRSEDIEGTIRNEINRKRNWVISKLSEISGVIIRGSNVGMFVTFDIRNLGIDGNDFAWRLLNEYDIALLPCTAFGPSGEGILRMNIGESDQNLQMACERIHHLISKL